MNKKRLLSHLLTGIMVFSMAAPVSGATQFPDMPDNWSTNALQNAVDNGLITGVPEGGKLYIKPNHTLKRAEMASIINKAFGSSAKAGMTGITDVKPSDWYYDHIAMAIQMESFARAALMRPNDNITREEAFTVLAKVFKLPEATSYSVLSPFTDAGNVSDYAKGRIAALLERGYISGAGNKLNPKNNITRAEFAAVMDNIVKQYISASAEVTKVSSGNMIVNAPNVILRGVTISGDLIIADGVGKGDVRLDDVKVNGRLVIRGGGPNSVEITGNSTIKEVIVDNLNNQVRVYADSNAKISALAAFGQVILDGTFTDVSVVGEDTEIDIYGTVNYLNVETLSRIFVDKNATLKTTDIQKTAEGSVLEGEGKVEQVTVRADDIQINTNKTKITVVSGVENVSSGSSWLEAGKTFTSDANASSQTPPKAGSSYITKVELNVTSTAFSYGNTSSAARKKITATITPSNVPDKQVKWNLSGTYASRYDLYDAATSGNLVDLDKATNLLTVYVAPAVTSLSLNHTAKLTVTTVDGNQSASCEIVVSNAAVSATPKADVTNVAKTAATQKSVAFTLTNAPTLQGSWRVFTDASNTTLAPGINCSNSGATLTLSHATDVPAGTYYVAVTEADKTESNRLALTVSPFGAVYTITGTITGENASGGIPATLQLKNSAGQNVGPAVTAAANGTYTISGVSTGNGYTIAVSCNGYTSGTITSFVLNGNKSGMNLVLSMPKFSIEGTITGEGGAGIAADIQLIDSADQDVGPAITAGFDGKFKISGVAPGTYSIYAKMSGYYPSMIDNVVVNNADVTLAAHPLTPLPVVLTVEVFDDDSNMPFDGATVTVTGSSAMNGTTDADGKCVFNNVPKGTYDIVVTAAGYETISRSVSISASILEGFYLPLLTNP